MPAFRDINSTQLSEHLGKYVPAIYREEDGWQYPETINPLAYHNLKFEHHDVAYIPSKPPLTPSSSCSPPIVSASLSASHQRGRTRRRYDPDYIPRPRNAFIIFRSFYVRSGPGTVKGHQNELSKHAGIVWNTMSDEQKRPFCEEASREKDQHCVRYPGYAYAPARNVVKRKRATNKDSKPSVTYEDQWSRSSATSSESLSPGGPSFTTPSSRNFGSSHSAAQYGPQVPIHTLLPTSSRRHPPTSRRIASGTSFADVNFVPTSEIPVLELSPKEEKLPKAIPDFAIDPSPFHHHFDCMPEQFGFRQFQYGATDPTLPALPRSVPSGNDIKYTFTSTPAPSSLLCDNPYPSADYLASALAVSHPYAHSFAYDGQHPHFID